jgi:SAM-dependent methyltransferase
MGAMKTLDLGCGPNKTPGAVGIDGNAACQPDICHNLNVLPYPLPADDFDEIICSHVIEHVESPVAVMTELHRVAKPGAVVRISTPHFSSISSWRAPDHRYHFALHSFDFFAEGGYAGEVPRFRLRARRLLFGRSPLSFLGKLIYSISSSGYEAHFAFLFPAKDIHVELEVVK